MLEPRLYSQEECRNLLKKDFLEVFLQLRDLELNIGSEHSAFLDSSLTRALQKKIPAKELMPVFYHEGRFTGKEKLFSYFQSGTQENADSKQVSLKLLEKSSHAEEIFDIRCFAGKSGHKSSLHFDWNVRDNIVINLIGRKSFALYPPQDSSSLTGYSNFSLNGNNLKSKFVITLEAGEGVFIPSLWWHEASYLTDACSLSLRLKTFSKASEWMNVLYPTWKLVEVFGTLGPEKSSSYFEKLSQLARKEDSAKAKFYAIEKELRTVSGQDDHPLYQYWIEGYLRFKELTAV